jgi:hypothetical protein
MIELYCFKILKKKIYINKKIHPCLINQQTATSVWGNCKTFMAGGAGSIVVFQARAGHANKAQSKTQNNAVAQ